MPQREDRLHAWQPFVAALATHTRFRVDGDLPTTPGVFDAPQIEQALINLLKNAAESGRTLYDVTLAQALLPFYSTKREGSGLGLALAREIAEAHGGALTLANRDGGGLCVTMLLPASPPA